MNRSAVIVPPPTRSVRAAMAMQERSLVSRPPASAPVAPAPRRDVIAVFADPVTREVVIDFPAPDAGVLAIEQKQAPDGTSYHVLPLHNATVEQRAHHVFWSNGTQERIDELVKNGRGAGLRQTLRWLLEMRITAAARATGHRYKLLVIVDRAAWERYKRTKSEL